MQWKKYLLVSLGALLLSTNVGAQEISSSVEPYYVYRDFQNSLFKTEGHTTGINANIKNKTHSLNANYEYFLMKGIVPKKPENAKGQKIAFKYGYNFTKKSTVYLSYLNVIEDELIPDSLGLDINSYGLGYSYKFSKNYFAKVTQYYTDYEKYQVHQSDLKLVYKTKLENGSKLKFVSLTQYQSLNDKENSKYSKNAQDSYLSQGLIASISYQGYRAYAAGFFGERLFAVMLDGMKLQHRAMEFDRLLSVGARTKLNKNLSIDLKYVYQRAEEIVVENPNVEVNAFRVSTTYSF